MEFPEECQLLEELNECFIKKELMNKFHKEIA